MEILHIPLVFPINKTLKKQKMKAITFLKVFRKWCIIHTHTSYIKYILTNKDIHNTERLEGNIQK